VNRVIESGELLSDVQNDVILTSGGQLFKEGYFIQPLTSMLVYCEHNLQVLLVGLTHAL
jgi:hypothetical protein